MQPGQLGLDCGDFLARPDTAEHAAQPVAELGRVRERFRRSGNDFVLAIGRSRRDVDSVERGAAHQPHRMTQICVR